ncbi:glycosyltransferase family 4 protein [Flavihumibacter sp. R14]|nr:glycosyltransferase family 4 protein [Flavihumibacter soli]
MHKRTIAFIIQTLSSGGAERVVSTLANELCEEYNVIIITLIKFQPFYELSPKIKLLHCVESVPPSKNIFQALQSNYKLFSKISEFIKTHRIDLTIGFLTSANVLAVLASKFNSIPVMISERNNPFLSKAPFFWEFLRKKTYPKAEYLIVQTEKIYNYFAPFVDSEKLKILPNPISSGLTLSRNPNEIRNKIILNVGSLTKQKAQDQLIKAFAGINYGEWELHIVGRGPKEDEYRELIESLKLKDKVMLLSPTAEVEKHYNSAAIFAFTSIYEGFPNALIEAMHFGLACVSTDCPTGPSELINNGENGFLIPMNDQAALQGHLQSLIDNETLRAKIATQAIESVRRFEAKTIVRQWKDLIERAMAGKSKLIFGRNN